MLLLDYSKANDDTLNLDDLKEWLKQYYPIHSPFSSLALEFCHELSTQLGNSTDPDITALSFWLRPAHIQEMQTKFLAFPELRMPRGLVFHITASNVDTLFVYSWILSLLLGNGNIVRLPNKQSKAIQEIIQQISTVLSHTKYNLLARTTCFVRYGHQTMITQAISEACGLRILWGSNETIRNIRAIPLNVYAKEIVFPDRFSFSVIDTQKYINCTELEQNKLAQALFRDVYGFDQNGCSSPRQLFFVGKEEIATPFFKKLQSEIQRRGYELPLASFLQKQTAQFVHATKINIQQARTISNELSLIESADHNIAKLHHPGGGLIYWDQIGSLEEIVPYLNQNDQTMTYFGFDSSVLNQFACSLKGFGPTRIVPIGEALTFTENWDGFDLLHEMTKVINVI